MYIIYIYINIFKIVMYDEHQTHSVISSTPIIAGCRWIHQRNSMDSMELGFTGGIPTNPYRLHRTP